jgi:hypothetical protein
VSQPATEHVDRVIRDYIEFLNGQQGMYMDALAGFAGHHTQIERQIHREQRPTGVRQGEDGKSVVLWTSYEDPTQPDVIHNRIIRATDYLATNAPGGANEQQHAHSILVFIYTYWELETRPRLAGAKGCDVSDIRADIMGDLRLLRNAILHAKGIIRADTYRGMKKLTPWLIVDQPAHISFERMKQIFIWLHQACALIVFEWLRLPDAKAQAEQIVSLALQNVPRD